MRVERSIMNLFKNKHIVRLHEDFEDDKNVYLVMEICEGGNLK